MPKHGHETSQNALPAHFALTNGSRILDLAWKRAAVIC